MIRHVKAEYWETSDGQQFSTRDEADVYETRLLVCEVLKDQYVLAPESGLMKVAIALCTHPQLLIMRAQHNPEMKPL